MLCGAQVAPAAPKTADSKAAFNKGVKAYKAKDYAAASKALGESYMLEADIETLYAWAQAERQLGNCENALDLYDRLLSSELPGANIEAVKIARDECKAIIAAKHPAPEPVAPEPVAPSPPPPPREGRPWWKDPLGDTLAGVGVVGLGVGIGFLVSARSAEADSKLSYANFARLDDKAQRNGTIGMVAVSAGAVLLTAGIVRYVTRSDGSQRPSVSGWLDLGGPASGGFVVTGGF